MTALTDVLEWKLGAVYFDARCRSRDGAITEWDADAAGRAQPTPQEIATWTAEFEAAGGKVPQRVTRLGAQRALRVAGMLATVESWIAQQSDEIQDAWNWSVEFERNDPLVVAAQDGLGLTAAQMDDLFRSAKALA